MSWFLFCSTALAAFLMGMGCVYGFMARARSKTNAIQQDLATKLTLAHHQLKDFQNLQENLETTKAHAKTLELTLAQERATYQARVKSLEEMRDHLTTTFQDVSSKALQKNNQSFLSLAEGTLARLRENHRESLEEKEKNLEKVVTPLHVTLAQMTEKIQAIEKERTTSYHLLRHQVGDLTSSQKALRDETAKLVQALKTPHIRGRWGEMQLRRVVEMSGMSQHCDFMEQTTATSDNDAQLRPDMIVNLPGGKSLIIDAKAPLSAYLQALEATDEETRKNALKTHARHIRQHIHQLSSKNYWQAYQETHTPEFVVLFLPGEPFFSAALEQDADLIEIGIEKQVILATPATLIALLHAIAYGWRQESLASNAREISQLGQEIYKRLGDFSGHLTKLGQDLGKSTRAYNQAIGSLESRVLPSARRFRDLQAVSDHQDLGTIPPVAEVPRMPQAAELLTDPKVLPMDIKKTSSKKNTVLAKDTNLKG